MSATSGLGLAGTRRRGGAGGIGACWSLGPWRTKPPGPIERTMRLRRLGRRRGLGAASARARRGRRRGLGLVILVARRGRRFGGRAGLGRGGGLGLLADLGLGLGRRLVRLHRRGARLQAEPVRLADHGVARDAAELVGDVARGHALGPQLLQAVDPFVGPGQGHASLPRYHGLRATASATSDGAVSDQPSNWVRTAPGVPVIRNVNWGGLATLYVKEVRRFFKVQLQTIWAPALTTLLFLVIFTVALGRSGRMVDGALPLRRFPRPRPDRDGHAPERLRQFLLLAAGRQDPGHDRRLSDAAAVDRPS